MKGPLIHWGLVLLPQFIHCALKDLLRSWGCRRW